MTRTGPVPPPPRGYRFLIGSALLLVALSAAGLLTLDHLGAIDAPGCGKASPCQTLAEGRWGRVPGIGWPVSFLGAAWFAGLLAGWLASRGRPGLFFIYLVRVGGVGSIVFTTAMLMEGVLCPYCLAVHAANFVFWGLCELGRASPTPRAGGRGWAAAALGFCAVSLGLGIAETAAGERARGRAERELAGSTEAIRQADPGLAGFSGRYRRGPAQARVRIVAFTDYQCPDCAMVEQQIEAALRGSGEISLSVKHFPMCTECNPHAANLHANACWAARAAEAAGILGGDAGFWKIHDWLFARAGSFTEPELEQALRQLGFDPPTFLGIMEGPETLARVASDVEEGISLGLFQTPMVFINGVELRGWNAPQAVSRAIAAALQSAGAPAGAEADRPPSALEKVVEDWLAQPSTTIPTDNFPRVRGALGAPVRVVVWGDYQEPTTCEADLAIREAMASADISYDFRPFPVNQECNPVVPRTAYPWACLAAQAAEAAAMLGGDEGFAQMHDWLIANREFLTQDSLMVVAPALGFEAEALAEAMQFPELMGAILEDVAAGHEVGIAVIPAIFINDRFVPQWKVGEENFLPFLLDAAAGLP